MAHLRFVRPHYPHVTTKRKVVAILLALFAGVVALFAFGYYSLKEGYAIRTSSNASPADVTFLRLPPSATRIGFFRDGINYCAEFGVSEDEFRKMFAKFTFKEISQPTELTPKNFGDPQMFEHLGMQLVIVTNGLRYNERWSNGGGYTIIYDRSQSRAYYDFAKR